MPIEATVLMHGKELLKLLKFQSLFDYPAKFQFCNMFLLMFTIEEGYNKRRIRKAIKIKPKQLQKLLLVIKPTVRMGMLIIENIKLFWKRDDQDLNQSSNFSIQVCRFPLNNFPSNLSLELLAGCQ